MNCCHFSCYSKVSCWMAAAVGIYVGSYFLIADRYQTQLNNGYITGVHYPIADGELRTIYKPIHSIDRLIRKDYWGYGPPDDAWWD